MNKSLGMVNTPSNKNKFPEGFSTPTKKNKFSIIKGMNTVNTINIKLHEDINKSKEDSEFFEYEEEKKEELTNDEKFVYGMREPKDYRKIKLLGKYVLF